MKFGIGSYRHPIEIQQPTKTRRKDGSVALDWSEPVPFLRTRARIRPKRAGEDAVARGITASIIHEVRIRYRAGITSEMRILFGSRVFEITGAINWDERNRELMFECVEVT